MKVYGGSEMCQGMTDKVGFLGMAQLLRSPMAHLRNFGWCGRSRTAINCSSVTYRSNGLWLLLPREA